MSSPILLGLGHPLIGIHAEVDSAFLEKYRLKANDAILANPSHSSLYTDMISQFDVSYVAGGASLNTIRGAQWLLPAGQTAYIGCVGKDKFADQLTNAAKQDGVSVHYMQSPNVPTGTCALLISNNGTDRSMIANLSAAQTYNVTHLYDVWDSVVKDARIYYVSGFFLSVSFESIMAIAKFVYMSKQSPNKIRDKKIMCMNLSAPYIAHMYSEQLLEVIPYVDYLFGNEAEAISFAEMNQWEEQNTLSIAQKILITYPKLDMVGQRTIVFTQGPGLVIIASMDYKSGTVITNQYPVIPMQAETIVDTTGAGDAFVGGFLAQLAMNMDLNTCIKAGVWTAHIVLQQLGVVYPKSVQVPTDFSASTFTQL